MSVVKEMKAELRQLMKKVLDKISVEETKEQSEAVFRKIIDSKWFQESKRLSVYVSTTGEIQTDLIIKKSLEMGKEVFIPQFTKGSVAMEMVRLPDQKSFDDLPSTLWGIRQPDPKWKWESYHMTEIYYQMTPFSFLSSFLPFPLPLYSLLFSPICCFFSQISVDHMGLRCVDTFLFHSIFHSRSLHSNNTVLCPPVWVAIVVLNKHNYTAQCMKYGDIEMCIACSEIL
ncbi:Protein CBG12218 [Caenorhabditis briggsae]|uniref:5-formyltetrahydrofolate cyclo-ligase n=1 Tax=Caenorhabditis briggsae TaxID=6238 RepID=A8XEZ0_CAEBR|nr:Protein CBG12218 [Caenorhabditis briggsae]CAP31212.2 Protein CBG12218 [Caenorhabditis briggsae]